MDLCHHDLVDAAALSTQPKCAPGGGSDTLPLQVVKADPQRQLHQGDLWTAATEIQGHLILHFEVGKEPVLNHFGESNWSQIPSDTQKSFDYWAELGESGIAPGGRPDSIQSPGWEKMEEEGAGWGKDPSSPSYCT